MSKVFVSDQFAMAKKGYVWHLLDENENTKCGIKTDGNWQFGQTHPDRYYSNYCKHCMRSSDFMVVKGVDVR